MFFKSQFVSLVLVVVIGSTLVSCRPEKTPDQEDYSDYADAGGQDGEIGKSSDVPEFITTNQTIEAVIGQKLNIGCQVNKLDHTQLIWKVKYESDKSDNLPSILKVGDHLYAGVDKTHLDIVDVKEGDDSIVGNLLKIEKVVTSDAGRYICSIAVNPPKEVHFDVKVVATQETKTDAATSSAKTSQLSVASMMLATLTFVFVAVYRQ